MIPGCLKLWDVIFLNPGPEMKNNELILLRRDLRPLKFHYETFEPGASCGKIFIYSLFQHNFSVSHDGIPAALNLVGFSARVEKPEISPCNWSC